MLFLKISDFLSRKQVFKTYKEYLETQWFSLNDMERYQITKLQKLINHCYYNVPYYKRIIEEKNIDITKIQSLEILKKFPILTKEIVQDNYKDFLPLNCREIRGVKTTQTGGTTGNILFKRNDAATRSSIWATFRRYEDWMDYKRNDKLLILMGGHVRKASLIEKIKSRVISYLYNSISVDIYNTSNETIEKVVEILKKKKIRHIRAYPQFLYSVAKFLQDKNMTFKIKSISTTAEPIMYEHRKIFREVFNCEVFDQYGCGEIGGIAYECNHHKGLHISEERVILEVNEYNELIVTDLDNFSMPFIRYWNADQILLDNNPCSCGRKSTLIKKIMGRTCDYVIGINGEFLHWAYFWHLIFDSDIAEIRNLRKFQVIQKSHHELLLRLVCNPLSEDEITFICSDIKKRVGEMKVNFRYEDDIENASTGKYRPVINLVI